MDSIPLTIKFDGGVADQHRLPAYEGSESLRGLTRAIVIPVNYLFEGRVRHRRFTFDKFDLRIVGTQPGSLEFLYEIVFHPGALIVYGSILGAGADGAKEFIKEFVKSTLDRAIGKKATPKIEELEDTNQLKSGDTGALVEAIEPSLREGHRSIGNGVTNIFIIQGDGNHVHMDYETKRYVNDTIEDEQIRSKVFSVGGYSADSGYGRAYDFDLGRTIPFQLDSDADADTVGAVLTSMRNYAFRKFGDQTRSAVGFKYRGYFSIDGRLKRMKVLRARLDFNDL